MFLRRLQPGQGSEWGDWTDTLQDSHQLSPSGIPPPSAPQGAFLAQPCPSACLNATPCPAWHPPSACWYHTPLPASSSAVWAHTWRGFWFLFHPRRSSKAAVSKPPRPGCAGLSFAVSHVPPRCSEGSRTQRCWPVVASETGPRSQPCCQSQPNSSPGKPLPRPRAESGAQCL